MQPEPEPPGRALPLRFRSYDNWRQHQVACPKCDWKGTVEDGAISYFRDLLDSCCPRCDTMLAIVSYPTWEEARQHGDEATQKIFEIMDRRTKLVRKYGLNSPEQLPEIDEPEFVLYWDFKEVEHDGRSERVTVLEYGEQVIFEELAFWEGYARFGQVAKVLQQKYGRRLKDLVPTQRSRLYLWGDDISGIAATEQIRAAIRNGTL